MKRFLLWCMGPQVRKNCFLGFVKWFFPWSVAPPAKGAGGIPTSPLCPPGPSIPPSNGRGIPPAPPCAGKGTFPCLSTGAVSDPTFGLAWGPQPIGCRGGHALCMAHGSRGTYSRQGGPAVTAPCRHSRDKPAPKRRGRDQLRQAAFSPKANAGREAFGFHE